MVKYNNMTPDKRLELEKKAALDLKAAKKLNQIKQSADSRTIDFCMTFTEVKRLLNTEKCYFTGVVLNETNGDPNQRTFDRVDNDKGYVNGNVVACSREFNEIKGNITIEQVKLMTKAFKRKKLW